MAQLDINPFGSGGRVNTNRGATDGIIMPIAVTFVSLFAFILLLALAAGSVSTARSWMASLGVPGVSNAAQGGGDSAVSIEVV